MLWHVSVSMLLESGIWILLRFIRKSCNQVDDNSVFGPDGKQLEKMFFKLNKLYFKTFISCQMRLLFLRELPPQINFDTLLKVKRCPNWFWHFFKVKKLPKLRAGGGVQIFTHDLKTFHNLLDNSRSFPIFKTVSKMSRFADNIQFFGQF